MAAYVLPLLWYIYQRVRGFSAAANAQCAFTTLSEALAHFTHESTTLFKILMLLPKLRASNATSTMYPNSLGRRT